MDARSDSRGFLISRRAKVTPERAGLPAYGTHRWVAGLRREELAPLGGINGEAEAGPDPYDRRLSDLIGELSTPSDVFPFRWAGTPDRPPAGQAPDQT